MAEVSTLAEPFDLAPVTAATGDSPAASGSAVSGGGAPAHDPEPTSTSASASVSPAAATTPAPVSTPASAPASTPAPATASVPAPASVTTPVLAVAARGGVERGVLLLHGFTGTPFEMRYLGERLAERGFHAVGPLLPGHGATVRALDQTTWRDWVAAATEELAALRRRCERVAIVGMSMGGLLALHLAAHRPDEVSAIAALGAPLWLPRRITAPLRGLHWAADLFRRRAAGASSPPTTMRLPAVPKLGGSDVRDEAMRRLNPSLPAFPLHALRSLVELMGGVRALLPQVQVPTFVAHADHDHVAPPACAREIVDRIGTNDVRFLPLPRSFHIVTIDVERDLVARELARFLEEKM